MGRNTAHNDAKRRGIKTNYYVDGNTVRRLEGEPEERRRRQLEQHHRRVARRNQERTMRVNFGYVLFCTMALTVTCVVCITYIKLQSSITARTKRISALESGIESLRAENDAAVKRIELTTDLDVIKKKALEYGMKYAAQNQILFYSIDEDDYMDQYFDIPQN